MYQCASGVGMFERIKITEKNEKCSSCVGVEEEVEEK